MFSQGSISKEEERKIGEDVRKRGATKKYSLLEFKR